MFLSGGVGCRDPAPPFFVGAQSYKVAQYDSDEFEMSFSSEKNKKKIYLVILICRVHGQWVWLCLARA
tara:strand:+ start:592 stop:795 length:204 start_codon:yes stop_codon:yes gene_type:complete